LNPIGRIIIFMIGVPLSTMQTNTKSELASQLFSPFDLADLNKTLDAEL
jgi:hypothetical protein